MNKKLLILAMVLATLAGCDSGKTVKTKSGVEVQFVSQGDSKGEDSGFNDQDIIFYNLTYKDDKGNVLFSTADQGTSLPMQYNKEVWTTSGLLREALSECRPGDSVVFDIPAGDFFEKTIGRPVPDSLTKESNLTFFVGIEKVRTTAELQAERDAGLAEETKEDGEAIDKYLAENNIEAQTTPLGLRYVITTQGDGEKPESGDMVFVHYHGTLLDGTKFDSSYDRGQPFSFQLGQGRVIRGWDIGLALLNKGSRATLYIPSALGYGARGAGATIKPFSILKFDVELLDIQKSNKQ